MCVSVGNQTVTGRGLPRIQCELRGCCGSCGGPQQISKSGLWGGIWGHPATPWFVTFSLPGKAKKRKFCAKFAPLRGGRRLALILGPGWGPQEAFRDQNTTEGGGGGGVAWRPGNFEKRCLGLQKNRALFKKGGALLGYTAAQKTRPKKALGPAVFTPLGRALGTRTPTGQYVPATTQRCGTLEPRAWPMATLGA